MALAGVLARLEGNGYQLVISVSSPNDRKACCTFNSNGQMKNKKNAVSDNAVEWMIAGLALAALIIFGRLGMPQKWHAAIMWTAVAFGPMTITLRRRWKSWSFWAWWTIYLGLHAALMWVVFALLLTKLRVLGTAYVVPLGAVETFVFLVLLSKRHVPRPIQSQAQ
jgi:hypothetical protein